MKTTNNYISQQKTPWNLRTLYAYFNNPINRNVMLSKLENGINLKLDDIPPMSEEEDEISYNVLTNWRKLSKIERYKYVSLILHNSKDSQVWAMNRKERIKEFIKDKVNWDSLFKKTKESTSNKEEESTKEDKK